MNNTILPTKQEIAEKPDRAIKIAKNLITNIVEVIEETGIDDFTALSVNLTVIKDILDEIEIPST